MSGGGGGARDGAGGGSEPHAMITLEDLESFTEDQLSDSGNGSLEEEGETMEEGDDPDRLLHYWQDVARGHQVEVSQGKRDTTFSPLANKSCSFSVTFVQAGTTQQHVRDPTLTEQ